MTKLQFLLQEIASQIEPQIKTRFNGDDVKFVTIDPQFNCVTATVGDIAYAGCGFVEDYELDVKCISPIRGGVSDTNGLNISDKVVIVYDKDTLEIVNTFGNYNEADDKVNEYYRNGKPQMRTECLEYYNPSIKSVYNLIGMNLAKFEYFIECNPTHPLIEEA